MRTGVSVKVLSNGQTVNPDFELYGVDLALELNRVPWARLTYLDGDASKPEFRIANAKAFEPGNSIEIQIGYSRAEGMPEKPVIFQGLVVGHRLEVDAGNSTLTVEIQDNTRRMTQNRQSRVFENKKDADILSELVRNTPGLSKGQWPDTGLVHEKMVQFNCTDWDFMLSRAEANGLLVAVQNGTINLLKADAAPTSAQLLTYGNSDMYEFEIAADGSEQVAGVQASGWDIKDQKRQESNTTTPFEPGQGNLDGTSIAKKLGHPQNLLQNGIAAPMAELNAWASGSLVRSRLSLLRGRVAVPGMPRARLGDFLNLQGLGARFNGKALISGIRHRVSVNGWDTDLQLGLSAEPYWQNEHILAPPAAGLLPGVHGLQIGVVDKFEEDPQKEFRVKVKLPATAIDDKSFVWARLAVPDGGKERGWFFYPEPGDEVVVGFFNGDPRQAVVLGAMFGSNHTPPKGLETLSAENPKKGLVTKSGLSLLFDDQQQVLTIRSSESNSIILYQKDKKIEIKDEHNNTVTMSADGIACKSDIAFKIEAAGNSLEMNDQGVQLVSKTKMTVEAAAAMEIKGAAINLE